LIKNYMEDIVDLKLPDILAKYTDICKCSKCIEDIKALALNKLPPHYVVTSQGLLYTKTNELVNQFDTDVITEIVIAIETVSKSPRHEK